MLEDFSILLDQNVPRAVAEWLRGLRPNWNVSHASEVGLAGQSDPEVFEWAQAHGHTLLELAFSWLATKPYVASVIAGATKPEQVRANASAAEWRLTDAEMKEVDALTKR